MEPGITVDTMDPDPGRQLVLAIQWILIQRARKLEIQWMKGNRKKIGFNGSRSLGFIYLNCVLAPPSSSRFAIILKLEIYNK